MNCGISRFSATLGAGPRLQRPIRKQTNTPLRCSHWPAPLFRPAILRKLPESTAHSKLPRTPGIWVFSQCVTTRSSNTMTVFSTCCVKSAVPPFVRNTPTPSPPGRAPPRNSRPGSQSAGIGEAPAAEHMVSILRPVKDYSYITVRR